MPTTDLRLRSRSVSTRRVQSVEAAAVLAGARRARVEINDAEARMLTAAVEWARLHEVDDEAEAATWGNTGIPLAGEGCPLIADHAVAEFAAVIGLSTGGGRSYLAEAIELFHRLPGIYARVQAGQLPSWRGRRVAARTSALSLDAVAQVDEQITPIAHKVSLAATDRAVDVAIARFMPAYAEELRERAAEQRCVKVDHHQVSFSGTSYLSGSLDLADALDLDDALSAEAEALKATGCEAPLEVRRAMALGMLARRESAGAEPARRTVNLVVHLTADDEDPTALVANSGQHLVTAAQVATWCGAPATRVVVKPVIDLHTPLSTTAYAATDRIKELLDLRDVSCVFPHCTRPAVSCDKDHIKPSDDGGETDTRNLANLCRHHHILKTHAGWAYTAVEPGVFIWRSPHGYTWLRDHEGTELLTPPPVEPP